MCTSVSQPARRDLNLSAPQNFNPVGAESVTVALAICLTPAFLSLLSVLLSLLNFCPLDVLHIH
jgi:hypothetical protein